MATTGQVEMELKVGQVPLEEPASAASGSAPILSFRLLGVLGCRGNGSARYLGPPREGLCPHTWTKRLPKVDDEPAFSLSVLTLTAGCEHGYVRKSQALRLLEATFCSSSCGRLELRGDASICDCGEFSQPPRLYRLWTGIVSSAEVCPNVALP